MSEDMKKLYDWLCTREESADKNLEKVTDMSNPLFFTLSSQATTYWEVKNFIECNFQND